ncbi:LppX_LprAFG lipoprotein [Kineosporia sp. A_224]|uniref:LppX_LprAFG lipoprotein n=1 Tax=Kineosporia sp. A_224 TaxID=1962180 RepID=UPI000B4A57F4|nr:LppX_LprAFG lipoprotein [Kineosporia sp. A_224]
MARTPSAPARRTVLRAALALGSGGVLAPLAGCSSDGGSAAAGGPTSAAQDPAALLAKARATLDAAPSLAFTLQGADLPENGNVLLGGTGDLERPDGFAGTLDVRFAGVLAKVEVVSTGGTFYAKLPLTTAFSKVDPKTLGFTDPGGFMNPETGISQLLSQAKDPKLGGESRVVSEVVRQVTATLPGALVDDLLTSADPAQDVAATFGITAAGELRQAELVGPFYAKGVDSTFTILLRDYGKSVQITAPA